MGRRRQLNTDLPQNMRLSRGKYYLVQCRLDGTQKWHPLGADKALALEAYKDRGGLSQTKMRKLAVGECNFKSLAELAALSAEPDCGIYFLWAGPDLLYVGRSVGIKRRVQLHRYMRRVSFDRYTVLPVPTKQLAAVEFAYVRHLRPPMNLRSPSFQPSPIRDVSNLKGVQRT